MDKVWVGFGVGVFFALFFQIEVLFKNTLPITPLSILSLTLHYRLKQSEHGTVTNSQDKASAALTTPPNWLLKLPKAENTKVPGHCLPTGAASLYAFKHPAFHVMPPPAAFI